MGHDLVFLVGRFASLNGAISKGKKIAKVSPIFVYYALSLTLFAAVVRIGVKMRAVFTAMQIGFAVVTFIFAGNKAAASQR